MVNHFDSIVFRSLFNAIHVFSVDVILQDLKIYNFMVAEF
jgi:hypothetical protein